MTSGIFKGLKLIGSPSLLKERIECKELNRKRDKFKFMMKKLADGTIGNFIKFTKTFS